MQKNKLERFISKYYLWGEVPSVVLNSDSNKKQLSTTFVSDKKTLLGKVVMDNWDLETANIGVYNTDTLQSLLGVLDNDISVSLNKAEQVVISLKATDSVSTIQYMLSDPSVIPVPPGLKSTPEYELKIGLDTNTITRYISGKSALKDTNTFTVMTNNGKIQLVIGYSTVNTNRVSIPVTATEYNDIENISFNAEYFKVIFEANKECENGLLEISSEGIAKLSFKVDDFTTTYWVVAEQDID